MYMYYKAGTALYIMSAIATILFIIGTLFKTYRWKKKQNLRFSFKGSIISFVKVLFAQILFQFHLLEQSILKWITYILILWGFLGLLAHTSFLAFLSHFILPTSPVSEFFYQGKGKILLDVWGDIWGTALLVGPIIAIIARYVFKRMELSDMAKDYFAIILLISISMTGFIGEIIRVEESATSPTYIGLIRNHLTISLLFIIYIPFSKMCQSFIKPIEQFFVPLGKNDKVNVIFKRSKG